MFFYSLAKIIKLPLKQSEKPHNVTTLFQTSSPRVPSPPGFCTGEYIYSTPCVEVVERKYTD